MMEVLKVWGKELWIENNDLYCGKKLHLLKGGVCSLHHHPTKMETFTIESGCVKLELEEEVFDLAPGESKTILPGQSHRFSGYRDSIISEFSTAHSDDDVVRKTESYLTPVLWCFDIDGTLEASDGIISGESIRGLEFGIVSSRSRARSLEICEAMGIVPNFVVCCRVVGRSEELNSVDRMFPIRRTIYVGDMESDKSEALRAGWQFFYPGEFVRRIETESPQEIRS